MKNGTRQPGGDDLMALALLDMASKRPNRPMSQTMKYISPTHAVRLSTKQHGPCRLCRSELFCEVWNGEYVDGPGKRRLWNAYCRAHMSESELEAAKALV